MIDKEIVKRVARISRISLSEEEIEAMTGEVSSILEAFSLIEEAETEDVKPSFHPIDIKNVVRDDTPQVSLSQDEALSGAGQREGKFFKGPRSV
jgi:aspartyl-tRNA(Asn)/glutamyl-tRNA(Gln) amidotransferase subunit C